ncbi:MAG: FtsW/RodA/SpoVE family cell cycle protein [Bacteroidetes bacterium]|nr:FtsW/RodA/SpoVE family cell cycle protein [Bacteroidota bacterium]
MIFSPSHKDKHSFIVDNSSDEVAGRSSYSDRWILVGVIALAIFGLLAVFSSTAYFAELKNTTAQAMLISHLFKVIIAFFVLIIFSKIDYRFVLRLALPMLILSWILLIIVTLYGTEVWGAKRFINVAGFSFQPSSLATVALLAHLIYMIERKAEKNILRSFRDTFVPMMIYVTISCALIGIEDFSSAAVLLALSMVVMFMGGVSKIQMGALVLIGVIGGSVLISSSTARMSRVTNYVEQVMHINSDRLESGSGYQSQQAYIAIARGQLTGVGMGKSAQRDFLPAPYNDFIYAIIAEEYGLIGASLILILYTLILLRGVVYVARNARTISGSLLATTFTITFVMYGYVNAAVATGLFPVTGLPMPFVSYGGTSMLFSGLMIGVVLNISKNKPPRTRTFF